MRTKLTIAYVGTRFAGWQRQDNAPTVQAEVEAAVAEIEGEAVCVHGAGRTDAGVHATGQVAHFESRRLHDPATWRRAINAHLSADIHVMAAGSVDTNFHARHSARGKVYRYTVAVQEVCSPFLSPFAWHVGPLDLQAVLVGQLKGLAQDAFLGERGAATLGHGA